MSLFAPWPRLHSPLQRRRPRGLPPGVVLGAVLLLHALLLIALSWHRVALPPTTATEPSPVWLRWIAPSAPATARDETPTPAAARAAPAPLPRPPRPQATPAGAGPAPALPQGDALPAGTEPPPPMAWVPGQAAPAASAPGTAPTPLKLDLPRAASASRRNLALDDPRSNTAQAGFETRLARALGAADGPITEERLADGTLRLRRGRQCVLVRPSRQAAIDPFNESISPKVRGVELCS